MTSIDHIDLDTYCGRIGRVYSLHRLCPPFALRHAAQRWIAQGIPLTFCVAMIERYLGRHAGSCYSGSGDWNFVWLSNLIQTTWYERSFGTPPLPAPGQHGRHHDQFDDHGAEDDQTGRRTPYTALHYRLNSRPGEPSPTPPAQSALADQTSPVRSGRSRPPGKAHAPGLTKIDKAVAWLQAELATGEQAAAVVEANARYAGIAPRTYDRARKRLGITSRRIGFGRWAKYVISLPVVDGTPNAVSAGVGAA